MDGTHKCLQHNGIILELGWPTLLQETYWFCRLLFLPYTVPAAGGQFSTMAPTATAVGFVVG
jgi:hypothetical protein